MQNSVIIELVGYTGSGKTMGAFLLIYLFWKFRKMPVLSNIWLSIPFEWLNANDIIELSEELEGKVVFIDEIQQYADSRNSQSKENKFISYFYAQHRHRNCVIIHTTQFEGNADKRIRQNSHIRIVCEGFDLDHDGDNDYFKWVIHNKLEGTISTFEFNGKPLFGKYNSKEKIDIFRYDNPLSKYLEFETNGKDILIKSKKGELLGKISFYNKWHKNVAEFKEGCIFDEKCLTDIVNKLNYEKRKNKNAKLQLSHKK